MLLSAHTLLRVAVLTGVAVGASAQGNCVIRTGLDAGHTVGTTNTWQATFDTYLNQALGSKLGCTFNITEYPTIDTMYDAAAKKDIDFVLTDVAIRECLEAAYGVSPVATLVNLVKGQESVVYGGSIVALANRTDLNVLQDIKGKKISAGQSIALAGAAQMQWFELHHNDINLFADTMQVMFAPDSNTALFAVLSGLSDVGFVRSDLMWKLASKGQVDINSLKILSPRNFSNYPYPTSTPLYPEWALGALQHVPKLIRNEVVQALMALNASSPAAKAVGYSTWTAPFSYLELHDQQHLVGWYNDTTGRCLRAQDFFGAITCPAGQEKRAAEDAVTAEGCARHGLVCPEGYNCICNPCMNKPSTRHRTDVLGMPIYAVVIIALMVALVICLTVLVFVRRQQSSVLPRIPYEELGLDVDSEVLGKGEFGPVRKGHYRGVAVAVRRILPHGSLKHLRHRVDCCDSLFGCEEYRLWRSSSHNKDSDNMFRTHSLLDIGRHSTSFSAIVRSLSSKSSFRTIPEHSKASCNPMLPIHVEAQALNGHPNRAALQAPKRSMWCFACGMCGLVLRKLAQWTSAAGHLAYAGCHKLVSGLKQQELKSTLHVAQTAIELRHPNIVATLGVSMEPRTGDLLLVESYVGGGLLSGFLENLTVEIEPTMALTVLRDVAAGMRCFHSMHPPILNTDLNTTTVLLDESNRAHLPNWRMHRPRKNATTNSQPFAIAPCVLRGEKPSTMSDVYSFGILMYEVLTRQEPFENDVENINIVLQEVADIKEGGKRRPVLPSTRQYNPDLVALMEHCWHPEPKERPSFKQVEERLNTINRQMESMAAKQLRRKAETSLLNKMLPPKVSAALREGRPVEPETYDCVTIFFSDIVGFTDISGRLQPQQVMAMLDRLYNQFDALTSKYELFKVETIGDAYMVVGNLRQPQSDHAARIARFALEAIAAANNTPVVLDDPSQGNLHIRVGFHSGPVVASVVGNMNPRYCLFGDTVNTASRMESTSLQDCIHMSSAAAQLLITQDADFGPRVVQRAKEQMVKGKGRMRTHWLLVKDTPPTEPDTAVPERRSFDKHRKSDDHPDPSAAVKASTIFSTANLARPKWRVVTAPAKQPAPAIDVPAPSPRPSTINPVGVNGILKTSTTPSERALRTVSDVAQPQTSRASQDHNRRTSDNARLPEFQRTSNNACAPDIRRTSDVAPASDRRHTSDGVHPPEIRRPSNTACPPEMRRTSEALCAPEIQHNLADASTPTGGDQSSVQPLLL